MRGLTIIKHNDSYDEVKVQNHVKVRSVIQLLGPVSLLTLIALNFFINMLVLILGVMVTHVTVVTQFVPFGETLMSQHLMGTKTIFMEMQFIFYLRQVKMQSTILESFYSENNGFIS